MWNKHLASQYCAVLTRYAALLIVFGVCACSFICLTSSSSELTLTDACRFHRVVSGYCREAGVGVSYAGDLSKTSSASHIAGGAPEFDKRWIVAFDEAQIGQGGQSSEIWFTIDCAYSRVGELDVRVLVDSKVAVYVRVADVMWREGFKVASSDSRISPVQFLQSLEAYAERSNGR